MLARDEFRKKIMKRIGPVSELVLVGGGSLLRKLAAWAVSVDLPVRVLSSPRHASEEVSGGGGGKLTDFLDSQGVSTLVVEKLTDESVTDFVDWNRHVLCVSLGAAWIFRRDHIDSIFGGSLLNLHGTRLPQNRGGGGYSWQILMGNPFGFCVLHEVDEGVDTGDIISAREFLYPAWVRTPQDYAVVHERENFSFVTAFIDLVRMSEQVITPVRQSEWFSSYWPRLFTEVSGQIDWSLDVSDLQRFICAFDQPHEGASTFLGEQRVFLQSVSLNLVDGYFHPYQSGLVYRKSEKWLCVAAKGGGLVIEKITGENGQDLFPKVKEGDRFVTPLDLLEKSRTRVSYSPNGLVM